MAVVKTVQLKTWQGTTKQVELLHPQSVPTSRKFETTLVTGQNGSHKSTLLKQLVSDLIIPSDTSEDDNATATARPHSIQVLGVSGSLADRFPQKEKPGGGRTPFDLPNYTYFGQRVYSNLLSKKAPLETMIAFALAPSRLERYKWNFYSEAHKLAGIEASVAYVFRFDQRNYSDIRQGLLEKKPDDTDGRRSDKPLSGISYHVARWLLEEFSPEDFENLEKFISHRRKIDLVISINGPYCKIANPNIIRLALLLDLIKLSDATVTGVRSKGTFSIFELSSGEYHMLTTILGIGFSLEQSAVVLIDEPENNLHPQWQRALMASVFELCDKAMSNGHLIISTHSPLIVGSAVEGSTIVDLTTDEPQLSLVSYGASSDQLLLTQFGVGSSRNRAVVDIIQRAISLVERGDFNNEEFISLIPELAFIREALVETDPMIDVIDALLEEESA